MARKKKETDPVKLKGYCPRYIQHIYTGDKYFTFLNVANITYLCARKGYGGYVGTEAPVFAVWKEEVREISEDEFLKDESLLEVEP